MGWRPVAAGLPDTPVFVHNLGLGLVVHGFEIVC